MLDGSVSSDGCRFRELLIFSLLKAMGPRDPAGPEPGDGGEDHDADDPARLPQAAATPRSRRASATPGRRASRRASVRASAPSSRPRASTSGENPKAAEAPAGIPSLLKLQGFSARGSSLDRGSTEPKRLPQPTEASRQAQRSGLKIESLRNDSLWISLYRTVHIIARILSLLDNHADASGGS